MRVEFSASGATVALAAAVALAATAAVAGAATAAGTTTAAGAATVDGGSSAPLRPDANTTAVDGRASAADSGPTTAVSVTRPDAETIRYRLALSRLASADRLWVVVGGGATVERSSGFERVNDGSRTRLRWTGERPATLSVTVPVGPEQSTVAATADAWAFGRVPLVEVQWAANGSIGRAWPLIAGGVPNANASAAVGDRWAVVGDYRTVSRATPHGHLDLVVPTGAMRGERAERVADSLARAARDLDVGDHDESVLAFAAPGSVRWGGGSVPLRDEFWANADSRLDSPEAVWLHEYVHTRQSFRLGPGMEWFREASAEYYAARLGYQQGLFGREAMERHLDGTPSSATLTAPETWDSEFVPQRKGARVLAVLDRRIREETYGYRSLEDVFRRLNDHEGVVTYAVFVQTVAEVTGDPDTAWLDRHVDGSATVADQYGPDSRPLGAALLAAVGGTGEPGPATGVLASVRGEGAVFFFVATGLGLVTSLPLYGGLRRLERGDEGESGLEPTQARTRTS